MFSPQGRKGFYISKCGNLDVAQRNPGCMFLVPRYCFIKMRFCGESILLVIFPVDLDQDLAPEIKRKM
jgi:hypothetical protein